MSSTSITNEAQRTKFFDALSKGLSRYASAAYAGINDTTLNRWLKRAQADLDDANTENSVYAQWYLQICAIEAQFEQGLVTAWLDHVASDWRAAREYLRCRFPERYGQPANADTNANGHGDVTVVIARDDA